MCFQMGQVLPLHPGDWMAMMSERPFARRAKDALVSVYGGAGSGGAGDNGVVGAFRRRIDFVAPFR